MAITWTAIGESYFGGFSPVNLGAVVLIPLSVWYMRSRPDLARLVILIMTVVGLPVVISGLLSSEGSEISTDALKDLVFLPIAALCIRSVRDVDRTVTMLALVGLFLGLGAIYSVLGQPTTLFPIDETRDIYGNKPEGAPRAAGPFGEANFFALSMAVLIPFGLYLLSRGGWRAVLGAASAAAIVGGIFAAQSRGALLAVGLAVAVTAFAGGHGRSRIAALFVVTVGALGLVVFNAQVNTANEREVSGRATENLIAVRMFEDRPVFGVGFRRYDDLYRDYARQYGDDPRYERAPHSLPLEIAAEQGAVGIIGWLTAAYLILRYVVATGVWRHPLGRALVMAVGTYAIASLFLHGSLLRLLYILIGLLLAYGAALAYERRRPQPQP
jgi:O-antigen ligase